MVLAQFFGILPLHGVLNHTPTLLNFKIRSLRTYYSLLIILSIFSIVLTTFVGSIEDVMTKTNIQGKMQQLFITVVVIKFKWKIELRKGKKKLQIQLRAFSILETVSCSIRFFSGFHRNG